MYKILPTEEFEIRLRKLTKKDMTLKRKVAKTLKLLRREISYSSLRLHKLSGKDIWSISVNRSVRILIHIKKDKIYLLRIGTHVRFISTIVL